MGTRSARLLVLLGAGPTAPPASYVVGAMLAILAACGSKNRVDVDILGDAAITNPPRSCQSCGGGTICLLNQCAMACGQDRDCAAGYRCLRTGAGNGCVSSTQSDCSTCGSNGTTCDMG